MSFATDVKDDLARVISQKRCCRQAEVAAFLRLSGCLSISSKMSVSLTVKTQHAGIARKILGMIKDIYKLKTEMTVYRRNNLQKGQVYALRIVPQGGMKQLLTVLGVTDKSAAWQTSFPGPLNPQIAAKTCCSRAYLRGAFISAGSINDPGGEYHLEISCNDLQQALFIKSLMAKFDIIGKIIRRKQHYLVYLKEGDQIIDFLTVIGSYRSLLEFENIRIVKDVRNQVNRVVNCENANLNRTIKASIKQVEDINLIKTEIGLDKLPRPLQEAAQLRLENPQSSLSELANLASLSKSAINHRLRRLNEIADNIRDYGAKYWQKK
ncbi:MAG: DNA-binding protein WhiA [Bacillota bacterium]|jgi:DNA-binding protein WhiA